MAQSSHVSRAAWTVIDQAIVSAGNFLLTITLARSLAPIDYGTYALLISAFLAVQLVATSLIFYPLSVRLPTSTAEEQKRLLSAGTVLLGGICIPFCLLFWLGLWYFGLTNILIPTLLAFSSWQIQEMMRRGLLSQLRPRAAVIGDVVSYIGQAILFAVIAWNGGASIKTALLGSALTLALGSLINAYQIGMVVPRSEDVRNLAVEAWSIGLWSMASNLMTLLRHHIPVWTLAFISGPVSVATYQAMVNIVNVTNPMVFGLCSIIPQTAAGAKSEGLAPAWRASRFYAWFGLPPTFGYYALALLFPGLVLGIFYGEGSPYAEHTSAARLLLIAWSLSYGADVICAYLFGIKHTRHALLVNGAGTFAVAILVLPLSLTFGVLGTCAAVLAGNIARAAIARVTLQRMLAGNTAPLVDFESLARCMRRGQRHGTR